MSSTVHSGYQKILVAEDEREVREYLEVALRCFGYRTEFAEDGEEAIRTLREQPGEYSLVLLDLIMARKDGIETLKELRTFDKSMPVIILSSASSPLHIVDALKNGATDFLAKPVSHEELGEAIAKALRGQPAPKPAPVTELPAPTERVPMGSSGWARKQSLLIDHVGGSDVPVLIQGETGVGKEVLARQIHARSTRAKKPFLKLNCAALPAELVESELFGYERGAFTGALRNNPGKFEMADGGTILLDEIGDMDFKLQAKLLQVLQDGEFLRLGGKEMCRVDVRVIAATHCDLETAMAEKRFREDLYYRINVIHIEVPPLRDRKDEILALADHFLRKHCASGELPEISPELRRALLAHHWPGNIRELENVIRQLIVLRQPALVAERLRISGERRRAIEQSMPIAFKAPTDMRPQVAAAASRDARFGSYDDPLEIDTARKRPGAEESAGDRSILDEVDEARRRAETEAILSALNETLWNRKRAAVLLNIEYKALLYKMRKLGIGERAAVNA